jgi:hypothetical protein
MSQYGVGRETALAALGNSYANYGGSLANAQGQYGQSAAQSRGSMLGTLANANLGAYNTGNNYTRDMAKLGLARELGAGQLSVGSQTASVLPGALGGLGSAMGSALNGLSLSADGSPSASVYGGSAGGGSGGSAGAGGGGPAFTPTQFGQGREWYQSPQRATQWNDPTPAAVNAMDSLDNNVLGNIRGGSQPVFAGLDGLRSDVTSSPVLQSLLDQSRSGSRQLNNAYYSSQNMPSQMLAQTMGGLGGMMGSSFGQMNNGMNQFYANIPRDGAYLMGQALRQGSSDLNRTAGMIGSGYQNYRTGSTQDYQSGLGAVGQTPSTGAQQQQQQGPSDRQLWVAYQQGLISQDQYDAGRKRNLMGA